MLAIIFAVLFSLVVAVFATQNTGNIALHFFSYTFTNVPIYLVVLVALLIGLFLAWILHLLTAVSASMKIKKKNEALKEAEQNNLELTKKVHKMELENTKLTASEEDKTLIEDNSL